MFQMNKQFRSDEMYNVAKTQHLTDKRKLDTLSNVLSMEMFQMSRKNRSDKL